MEHRRIENGSIVGGLLFILLGIVFLASTQGTWNLNWGNIWPAFLWIGAILNFAQAPSRPPAARAGLVMGGTVLLLLGAFFFATTLGWFSLDDQGRLWPLYLLIVGVAGLLAFLAGGLRQFGYFVVGGLFTVIGGILLGVSLSGTLYDESFWRTFADNWERWGVAPWIGAWWPVLVILLGVLLVIAPRLRQAPR